MRPAAGRSTAVPLCVLAGAAGGRAGRRAAPEPIRHARRRGGDAVESGHRRPSVGRQRHGPHSRVCVGSRPEPARTGERVRGGGCVRAGPRASERAARALRPVWRGGPGRVALCWSPKVAVRYPGTSDDPRRCRAAWLCASLTPPSMRQIGLDRLGSCFSAGRSLSGGFVAVPAETKRYIPTPIPHDQRRREAVHQYISHLTGMQAEAVRAASEMAGQGCPAPCGGPAA